MSIDGDHLLWFDDIGPVSFAGGGASEQSFAAFLRDGPAVEAVPDDVVAELTAAVRRVVG